MDDSTSIIIPTRHGRRWLKQSLPKLWRQTRRPTEILVIDSGSEDGTAELAEEAGCRVVVIDPATFDHGATRNFGVACTTGSNVVFMTQDVEPADEMFLEQLTEPIRAGRAEATYARQIPRPDAPPTEVFARTFHYPDLPHVRQAADIQRLGIKAFFFSNASSAISRDAFEKVGGFPTRHIINEDMVLCARLLRLGLRVAYAADARVLHSHNHRLGELFQRYFDMGACVTLAASEFGVTRAGSAGRRFALTQLQYLVDKGQWHALPRCLAEIVVKFSSFNLGRRQRLLPTALKRQLSTRPDFWTGSCSEQDA